MARVTCYVAELNVALDEPLGDDLQLAGKFITDYIQEASGLDTGTFAINLTLDQSRRHSLPPPDGLVGDEQLQDALGHLLQSAHPNDGHPVGLILVGGYYEQYPNAYGVMFDQDMHEAAYGPRQGCAVFLNKIRKMIDIAGNSGNKDEDFRSQVAATAIHELGHAFNLWHEEDSIMAPSPDDYMRYFEFADDHKEYLRHAADQTDESFVLPGGSAFNDRGPIGPSGTEEPLSMPATAEALKLEIGLSHVKFWGFEPVELDVVLSVLDPISGAVTIPDQIDHGCAGFEIWITRPDGERRRYRSSMHFCCNSNTRRLSHLEPFKRDILIFRQSGCYSFSMVGKYEVQAVLRLPAGRSVESNIVGCEVLPARRDSEVYSMMREAFSSPGAIKLLRYRSHTPPRIDYLRLQRFAESHSSTASAAAVHYSLGRALVKSSGTEIENNRSGRLLKQGLFHLDKAVNHSQLSSHRRSIAERLLDESGFTRSI